jgi:hypothetical protein
MAMCKRNVALNAVLGCALSVLVCSVALGQGAPQVPPDFDPQKMQQMFVDRMKEMLKQMLGSTDEEWAVLEPRLEKVALLSVESRNGGLGGFGPGGPRGFSLANLGLSLDAAGQQLANEVAQAAQALQDTLNNPDATTDKIMTGMQALRDARKKMQQEQLKAKASLVEILTPQQEARLVALGILD